MTSRKIQLISNDDQTFEVERDVIKQSNTVNTLITDLGMDDEDTTMPVPIPLPKVDSDILRLILRWCEYHKDDAPVKDDEEIIKADLKIPSWDRTEFFKHLDKNALFDVTLAANYLDIKMLLEYCCKTVSDLIKGKKAEEIRAIFGIENDFTPEEEEAIRKENMWSRRSDELIIGRLSTDSHGDRNWRSPLEAETLTSMNEQGECSQLPQSTSTVMAEDLTDAEKLQTLVNLILTVFCLALFAAVFEVMLTIVTCVLRAYVNCCGDPGPYELPVYYRHPPVDSGDYVEMGPIHPCTDVVTSVQVVDETVSSPSQEREEAGSVVADESEIQESDVATVLHMTTDQESLLDELTSSDEIKFEVARNVIKQSNTVNTLMTDLGMDDDDSNHIPIPLPAVASAHLKLVIEWCDHHKDDEPFEEEEEKEDTVYEEKKKTVIPEWDQTFLKVLSQGDLFYLALAANYMDVKMLLKYIVVTIANAIRGLSDVEICKYFNVERDFTEADLEAIKKDNAVEIPL
ncbi:hypothetical protein PRIPAC_86164 [Pristionchus pacificus]|uniref:Uncharacterized protein n=1 Tax=Pristionchus pacificus TaxID=54126 RepID=A0A2A6CCB7_PRIPA|nr:hypothetical protein PRIPAC_86164 [Pristionchus pacificus]|eukprot:PDM75852.1 hypothetical protein PRIPAC_40231 [Pristionchus pacificus]